MPGIFRARTSRTTAPDGIPEDEVKEATDLAQDRYAAARRHYTHLYVELHSAENPSDELARNLDEARSALLTLAGRLPLVLAGEEDAVRHELATGPVPVTESSQVTDRFRIAELHRAAADADANATTWGWKLPAV